MMKRNDGFTLVELVVTIAAASLVTFAASSLLLMGARIQRISLDDAGEQRTARIVMSLLEDMAGSGIFNRINRTDDGWQLLKCQDTTDDSCEGHTRDSVILEYVAEKESIYQGEAGTDNVPLLTGLKRAVAEMESLNKVLHLSFETAQGGKYETRVYCRVGRIIGDDVTDTVEIDGKVDNVDEDVKATEGDPDHAKNRIAFLQVLATQYRNGNNTGRINGSDAELYYSEWYLNEVYGSGYDANPGWNQNTPWCACFVSWAATQGWSDSDGNLGNGTDTVNDRFIFANVDDGMARFKKNDLGGDWKEYSETPIPGDYIFFDWTGNKRDPAHVGVVLDVDENYIYTIEGNSSNRVAVRKYPIGSDVIMGYGVLPSFNMQSE